MVKKKGPYQEMVMATRNPGKLREIKKILADLPLKLLSLNDFPALPVISEDGATFFENARKKAEAYARLTHRPTIADDSGLCVEALQGKPGVYSSRFAGENASDEERYQKLLAEMEAIPEGQRQAKFVCAMAIANPAGKVYVVEGEVLGSITFSPQGKHGFGYDPIFFIPELRKTMAELPPEIKNQISHRAQALKKLKLILRQILA